MQQTVPSHKTNVILGIIAFVQVVVILGGINYFSSLHSQINQLQQRQNVAYQSYGNAVATLPLPTTNSVTNDLSQEKKNQQFLDDLKNSTLYDISRNYQKALLLNQVLSDYYLQKNSLVVGGATRVRMLGHQIFSIEIPKEIASEYSDLFYSSSAGDIEHNDGPHESLALRKTLESGVTPSLQVDFHSGYYSLKDVSGVLPQAELQKKWQEESGCTGNYDMQTLYAGAIFEQALNYSVGNDIDLCAYIVKQKDIPGVAQTWAVEPNLLHYKISTDPGSIFWGFTLNTAKLLKDYPQAEMEWILPEKRYFLAIAHPTEHALGEAASVTYRLIGFEWWSGLREPDPKDPALQEGKVVLDAFQNSLVNKSIMAPMCEYGCAY